jgi:hypothetical protein
MSDYARAELAPQEIAENSLVHAPKSATPEATFRQVPPRRE